MDRKCEGVKTMELKMYEFEGAVMVWVCAKNKEQAINIFQEHHGEDVWQEGVEMYGDDAVREMSGDEVFTYYHDGVDKDENTIKSHIKKYCDRPDVFAISDW